MPSPCNNIKVSAHDKRLERTMHKEIDVLQQGMMADFFPLISQLFCNMLCCLHN